MLPLIGPILNSQWSAASSQHPDLTPNPKDEVVESCLKKEKIGTRWNSLRMRTVSSKYRQMYADMKVGQNCQCLFIYAFVNWSYQMEMIKMWVPSHLKFSFFTSLEGRRFATKQPQCPTELISLDWPCSIAPSSTFIIHKNHVRSPSHSYERTSLQRKEESRPIWPWPP